MVGVQSRVAGGLIGEVIVDQEPFDYHDYHRTVVAFHGTTETVADHLVAGGDFTPSSNTYDWLGTGIYFLGIRPEAGLVVGDEVQEEFQSPPSWER